MTKKKEDIQAIENKITDLFYDAIERTLAVSPQYVMDRARLVARDLVVEITSRGLTFDKVKRKLEDGDWRLGYKSMLEDTVNDLAASLKDEFIDCCEGRGRYNTSNAQNRAYFALRKKG